MPVSLEDRIKWVHAVNPQENPLYTAILDNHVLGWLSVRPYRESRAALKRVKEVSYYVSPAWQEKGIGKALLAHAIAKAPALNIGTFLAIVLEKNLRSIGLLEKFGFSRWGFLPRVAEFDGEYCGHCYYGLHLE